MKRILLAMLVVPAFVSAQNKNVLNATRVFPKVDHVDAFEKAIGAHAQKYHKGDWSWRVFAIETGPDASGYHITEGPSSWTGFDGRGDLGAEHTADWNKNIAMHLTDRTSNSYSIYLDSLSTTALTKFTDKIMITHVYPKLGYAAEYIEHLKKSKKAWEAGKQSVAIYQTVASGRPGYTIVFRMADGLKEFEDNYRKSFRERYVAANGADSWSWYVNNQRTIINDESWSEILTLQPKMSSLTK